VNAYVLFVVIQFPRVRKLTYSLFTWSKQKPLVACVWNTCYDEVVALEVACCRQRYSEWLLALLLKFVRAT